MGITQWVLRTSRKVRSKEMQDYMKPLIRLGVTANHLTFLSFIAGIISAIYLFENHLLFVIFAIMHIFLDSIDGVLARLTEETVFGKYFDFITDGLVTVFLLAKTFMVVNDYYIIIFLLLAIFTQMIYFFSDFTYPILFVRTTTVVIFMFKFYALGYMVAGVLSIYSLMMQAHHYLKLANTKSKRNRIHQKMQHR